MGRLKEAVAVAPRPATRVQAVLDELDVEDRTDLISLLCDLTVSTNAISSVLRRKCQITLARSTILAWRENNPESCRG